MSDCASSSIVSPRRHSRSRCPICRSPNVWGTSCPVKLRTTIIILATLYKNARHDDFISARTFLLDGAVASGGASNDSFVNDSLTFYGHVEVERHDRRFFVGIEMGLKRRICES